MKKHTHDLIAEVPRSCSQVGITIGIDIGDVWSHYCTLNEDGEVVDQGRFRTNPSSVDKWFTDLPRVRIAMEAGTHSIWVIQRTADGRSSQFTSRPRVPESRPQSSTRFCSDEVGQRRTSNYDRCQFIQCSQPPKRCDLYRGDQFAFLRSGCGSLAGAALSTGC